MEHRMKEDPTAIDAPYRILNQDLVKITENLTIWERLLWKVPEPHLVHEGCGGYGRQTKIIRRRWPKVPIEVWEKDEECFNRLKSNVGGMELVKTHHAPYPCEPVPPYTLLVMDMSIFTLKHWATFEPWFKTGAHWVMVTDMSRGKYHLHPKAYGCLTKDWSEYLDRFGELVDPTYVVQDVHRTPRSISYILLEDANAPRPPSARIRLETND